MDLSYPSKILFTVSITLTILSYKGCSSVETVNIDVTTPCKDVADAINRIYRSLTDEMPLEARCKRYAVFQSMAEMEGATNELALLQLSLLREEIIDWLYEEIKTPDLATRYMTAIDAYLATRLEPAFIDLIECLRDIHTTAIKTYLDNPELKMVEELYRRVLASPAGEIDLESVDLRAYHPGFRATLQKLVEAHSYTLNQNSGQIDFFNQLSSSYLPMKLLAEQFINDTEKRVRQISMKRKRQLRCRHRHLDRVREIDRNRYWKKKELLRQQCPSIEQDQRWLPETVKDPQLKSLERAWYQRREAQRRYRERNRERLRVTQRDRRQRLQQQLPVPVSESSHDQQNQGRQQGLLAALLSPADQSASSSRPTILFEPPLTEQQSDTLDVQASDRPLWLERLDKLAKARCRLRERERRYRVRNPQIVREREREYKRRWRQRRRERQQEQVDPLPDELDGPAESTLPSESEGRRITDNDTNDY